MQWRVHLLNGGGVCGWGYNRERVDQKTPIYTLVLKIDVKKH